MRVMLDTLAKLEEAIACHKDDFPFVYKVKQAQASLLRSAVKSLCPPRKRKDKPVNGWDITANEDEILRRHGKIAAIKAYRERKNVGLIEAKLHIEKYMAAFKIAVPTGYTSEYIPEYR